MHRRTLFCGTLAIALTVAGLASSCFAQNSDFNLSAHANSHATAKDIGLPEYPGAKPWKDKDSDSSSADLGFVLNSFHFSVQAASYVTTDSPEQVLAFYRKPLAKYGDVLECDHGMPVGKLTVTKSGLTCGDRQGGNGHMSINGSDSDHELRAGSPERFHVVGIDSSENGQTKFGLVALELPKGS
ncbi:MAG TPA: hypothetical protein VME68_02380 [Acidobacteriaceae bacterium]|nr:hypothetical protein [Acidobacteriaceae bacterium]